MSFIKYSLGILAAFVATIALGLTVNLSAKMIGKKLDKLSLVNVQNEKERVILEKKNTLILRGVITPNSATELQQKILTMSHSLPESETIYLVVDSPGGYVDSGLDTLQLLNAIPQKVTTVSLFAASMAFITVESLGERLVTSNGVLMSHRMAGGVDEGHIPGEVNTRLNFYTRDAMLINSNMAKRMGLNLVDYMNLIVNEYWVRGSKAVEEHAADRVVNVVCGTDITDDYEEVISTILGNIKVTWSSCPLLRQPLNVEIEPGNDKENMEQVTKVVTEVLNNEKVFLDDAEVRDEYLKFVK